MNPLPRKLGAASAVAVIVGSIIGSGIFRTPAVIAERIGDPALVMLAWIAGGIIALTGALTFAELAALYPKTGGLYVYLREAFGRLPAFLFGWAQLVVLRPAALAAIAITSSGYMLRTLGVAPDIGVLGPITAEQAGAGGLIAIVGVVNYRGIELGAVVQNTSTILKVSALLALVGMGVSMSADPAPAAAPVAAVGDTTVTGFGLALVAVLWAYDGWSDVGYVGGEVRNPSRSLPIAFVGGTAAVVVLYLIVNAVYLHVIPLENMAGSPLIGADVALALVGKAGVTFVSAAVAVSTFGTLNGTMMTAPRVFYAMAADGNFFRALSGVHPRHGTPAAAIWLCVALGVAFASIRTFGELADQFVIGVWPFYALGVVAVVVLRRRNPDAARPFRAWGYPVTPTVFLLATGLLLGSYLVAEPLTFAADIAVIAVGIPVFLWWRRRGA